MLTLRKNSLKYKDENGVMQDSGVLFASDEEKNYATKEELEQLSEEIVDIENVIYTSKEYDAFTDTLNSFAVFNTNTTSVRINKLYGKSSVINGVVNADVDEVICSNGKTASIPNSIKSINGYGAGISDSIRNITDFKNNKFYRYLKKITFDGSSDEEWIYNSKNGSVYGYTIVVSDAKIISDNTDDTVRCISYPMTSKSAKKTLDYRELNTIGIITNSRIFVNSDSTTVEAFKSNLSANPITLYYQLEQIEIENISANIEVKCSVGDTIGFFKHNENIVVPFEASQIITVSKIDNIKDYRYLSHLFSKVLCIGDSLTEGYYNSTYKVLEKNYPNYLKRISNWDVTNQGNSGTDPRWYAHRDGSESEPLLKSTDYTQYDAVIIFYGTNKGISANSSDTTDVNGTPNSITSPYSEYLSYKEIIEKIKEVSPTTKIFVCTLPNTFSNGITNGWSTVTTNEAIKSISDEYDLKCIDLYSENEINFTNYDIYHPLRDGSHFGNVGYLTLAHIIFNRICDSIKDDKTYFEIPFTN